jgi:hypothetical protein
MVKAKDVDDVFDVGEVVRQQCLEVRGVSEMKHIYGALLLSEVWEYLKGGYI